MVGVGALPVPANYDQLLLNDDLPWQHQRPNLVMATLCF
jgi:hypothetical protein